jgi:hypothetical protein
MRQNKNSANKVSAGNSAAPLSFHIGRRGRAVPDFIRSPKK